MTSEPWLARAAEPGAPTPPLGVEDDPLGSGPPTGEQSTEWFSVDDYLSDEDGAPPLPRRDHHVTAVVVSHDGAVWLPAVLTTLGLQARQPDDVVGVDTGSVDGSEGLLASALGADRCVVLPREAGFGQAVAAGLERTGRPIHEPFVPDPIEWVWLLHDDSAPGSGCLAALLDTADDHPSAAILGPKILGWHDRRLLLEAGVTITGSGRRVTGLERREHDQGQHDGVRDVLAVSSAGMLVRRDVWEALEGFDPTLPLFRDDLDFCWRAHRRGERVLVATDAVVHHREASAHGRRADDLAPRPARADREASAHVLLSQATAVGGALVALRLLLGAVGRAVIYLLGKDVRGARDELGAVLAVALHPSRLRSSRALVRRTTTQAARVARPYRPSVGAQVRHALEVVGAVATTSGAAAPTGSVSALESGPVGDEADFMDSGNPGLVRRILLRPSVLVVAALTIVAILGTRGLWLGDGVLQGGALLPTPDGAGDLWDRFTAAWHDVGPGSTTPSSPYLMVVFAVAVLLLGKAPAAVSLLLLLSIPIAGWSAYVCTRGLVASRMVRVWVAAAYALLPAMTGAIGAGRVGTTIAAIALPFALRSCYRISGPNGTLRRAAGTALLVAIVLAATPTLWVVIVVASVVVALRAQRAGAARGVVVRLVLAVLGPLVLLLPWSGYLLTNPSLLLLQPGVASQSLKDRDLNPIDVLLLHPGGPGMTPLWLTAGIVAAGFLALLRVDRLRVILPILGIGLLAFAMGLVQVMVLVTPPDATTAVRPWPGPATLLLGLSFIVAAAVAFDGLRDRFIASSFSLGAPVAFVVSLAAVAVPVLTAGWYVVGLTSVLVKESPSAVPAFVAADAESDAAPRTLVVDGDIAGRVIYTLVNGSGPLLGDAETGPPSSAWAALDPYVAAMASGRGGDEIAALAGYGVRYVLLAEGASDDLAAVLDAEPGLRRLSSSGGEVLWRVAGTTTRARVDEDGKATAVPLAPGGRTTTDPYIDAALPDGADGRSLIVGSLLDDGWTAEVVNTDGSRSALTATAGPGLTSWSQAFTVPAGAPQVTVTFDSGPRSRWMWFELVVLLALVVMALPERRRVDPDPDTDEPTPDAALAIEAEEFAEAATQARVDALDDGEAP